MHIRRAACTLNLCAWRPTAAVERQPHRFWMRGQLPAMTAATPLSLPSLVPPPGSTTAWLNPHVGAFPPHAHACRPSWGWPSVLQLPAWVQGLLYYREIILRALLTVALLAVIRSGHFIPMPGVELQQLPLFEARTEGGWTRAARSKQGGGVAVAHAGGDNHAPGRRRRGALGMGICWL